MWPSLLGISLDKKLSEFTVSFIDRGPIATNILNSPIESANKGTNGFINSEFIVFFLSNLSLLRDIALSLPSS